jgi:hypothetical protein
MFPTSPSHPPKRARKIPTGAQRLALGTRVSGPHGAAQRLKTPTGFRILAQGWHEERVPTLGSLPCNFQPQRGCVRPIRTRTSAATQPRWGWAADAKTQGSLATLGNPGLSSETPLAFEPLRSTQHPQKLKATSYKFFSNTVIAFHNFPQNTVTSSHVSL